MKSHLLEFHAIVDDFENQEEELPNEMEEDEDPDESLPEQPKKNAARPSILKYFERSETGERFCKFCQAENICTKYSAHTSSTNMRMHLENKHGYTDDFSFKTKSSKKRTISSVWKYFCKPTRDGNILDNDHVYCGKCLENEKKLRYDIKTSTSTLRRHLMTEHSIDVSDDEEDNRPNMSKVNVESVMRSIEMEEEKKKRAKRITESSEIKKYFKKEAEFFLCLVCEKERKSHKFSQNTSSYVLKRHLIVKHNIDPHLESSQVEPKLGQKAPPQEVVDQGKNINFNKSFEI